MEMSPSHETCNAASDINDSSLPLFLYVFSRVEVLSPFLSHEISVEMVFQMMYMSQNEWCVHLVV